MNGPTISIVVPVYRAERYLSRTIESLERQTSNDFEVVFVDDGSPDDSVALISHKLRESKLNWQLIQQENQGVGEARNTGFYRSRGQWILFLDADDTLQSHTIETYCHIVKQNPRTDVIFSQYINVSEEEALKQIPYDSRVERVTREELLRGFLTRKMIFLVPGTLYRMEYLRSSGVIHSSIPWSEDQYFMWQVMNRLEMAIISHSVIYNYVHHTGESIMNSTPLKKVLMAYEQYRRLPEEVTSKQVKKYLLARWCLGCLHVFACRGDRVSFEEFWQATTFSAHCRTLLTFPSWKVRVLAVIGLLCKRILFCVMR